MTNNAHSFNSLRSELYHCLVNIDLHKADQNQINTATVGLCMLNWQPEKWTKDEKRTNQKHFHAHACLILYLQIRISDRLRVKQIVSSCLSKLITFRLLLNSKHPSHFILSFFFFPTVTNRCRRKSTHILGI